LCFVSLNLCCLPRPPGPYCLATGCPDTPGPHGRHCTYLRHQGRSDLSRHTRQHASLPAVCGIRNARLLKSHPGHSLVVAWVLGALRAWRPGSCANDARELRGWRPTTAYVCVKQYGWQFLVALSAGWYVTNAPSAQNPIMEIATVLFHKGISVRISPCVRVGAAAGTHELMHARQRQNTPSHHATPMADGASCGPRCPEVSWAASSKWEDQVRHPTGHPTEPRK